MLALKAAETAGKIHGVSSFVGLEHILIRFSCNDKLIGGNLHMLEEMGVGEIFGRVEVTFCRCQFQASHQFNS